MIGRIRAAWVRAFGGVELEPPEPESFRDHRRRERLVLALEACTHEPPLSVDDAALMELRRLALTVVCDWTDDAVSDADFQASVEQLANYLVRTV